MIRALTMLVLLLPLVAAAADTALPVEDDPVLEKRVTAKYVEAQSSTITGPG